MKIVITPQAFKGNISANQAAQAIERGIKRFDSQANTRLLPVADGGDGTLEVLAKTIKTAKVTGPLGEMIEAPWGIVGGTAIIEMAKVCGLALLPPCKLSPLHSTSYGLGELIRIALDEGYRDFIIDLGGTATNDAGTGMAKALGAQFLNANGDEIPLGGGSLKHLSRIDLSRLDPRIGASRFLMACDVQNSLIGPEGAIRIYAPQKGATPKEVEELEASFIHLAALIKRDLNLNVADDLWGGAAGGTAAMAKALLKGSLQPGIDLVLNRLEFDRALEGADLVIVGEGRMDSQTAYYKAPFGVARKAKEKNIPVIALVGSLGVGFSAVHRFGIEAILPLTFAKISQIPINTPELLSQAAEQAMRLVKICCK